ncbi:MAG: type II toxin-antitoxin system RelE family toxin, partial [Ferruginibacter sp.]
KQIAAIGKPSIAAIEKAIISLENIPRPIGCKKLVGSKNIFRIRVGIYRIVYEIHDKILTIFVFNVDHRKQVYK